MGDGILFYSFDFFDEIFRVTAPWKGTAVTFHKMQVDALAAKRHLF